jgi:hypothetical protein
MEEPGAKRIKTEGAGSVAAGVPAGDGPPKDPKGVELLLLGECKRHQQWISPQDQPNMEPPKDYEEHSLHTNKVTSLRQFRGTPYLWRDASAILRALPKTSCFGDGLLPPSRFSTPHPPRTHRRSKASTWRCSARRCRGCWRRAGWC